MIKYYLYLLKNKISPKHARLFFNKSTYSRKKNNKILSKSGIKISDDVNIIPPFYFECGNISIIGDVFINTNCNFLDKENITIQDGTMIGPNVTLTTVSHHITPSLRHRDNILSSIEIGKNVWIGAGVVVLPGIKIGDNSVVAANSVVNSDIPPDQLWAGCPAKFKRNIKESPSKN